MTKKLSKLLSLVMAVIMLCSVAALSSYAASSVAQVKNVKVVDTDEDEIELRWSKVKSAAGYQVYIKNGDGSWKKALTTKKTSADIEKLKGAETYSVKVRAYKTSSGKKVYGSFSSVVVTSTEPDEVQGVSIKASSSGKAKISWNKVAGADGYRVYKYNTSTKKWERVAKVKGTSATVSVSKNGGEKFRVRAYAYLNGKYYYSDASDTVQYGLDVIGYAKAKSIAINNAGVKSSSVKAYEVELEKEKGIYVYEIEFESGIYEYEYKINAETGKILFKEKELR